MKWFWRLIRRGQREDTNEGLKEATALREQLNSQADEVRKLTHSLRTIRDQNHLGEAIIRAMRSAR